MKYFQNEKSTKFEKFEEYFIAITLVLANIGFSEYLSVAFFTIIYLIFKKNKNNFFSLNNISLILVLFISFAVYGIELILSKPSEFLLHSILSHGRECLMIFITYSYINNNKNIKFNEKVIDVLLIILGVILLIQYAQITLEIKPFSLSKEYYMIQYESLLNDNYNLGYDRLRPTAFYSEPSVLSCIFVPLLYIFLHKNENFKVLLCCVLIIFSGSAYGYIGMILVLLNFLYKQKNNQQKNIIYTTFFLVVLLNFGYEYLEERLIKILEFDDMSYAWRFTYPLDYFKDKYLDSDFYAQHVRFLIEYGSNVYEASIFDTWPLYTLAKLGLVHGTIWIIFSYFLFHKLFWTIFFYTLVSGAPFYHDKVLLLMIIGGVIVQMNKKL